MHGIPITTAADLRLLASENADSAGRPIAVPCACPADHGDVSFELVTELSSVKIARDLTKVTLANRSLPELADSAALVVSELVTNALQHGMPPAGPARGWTIRVRLIGNLARPAVMCLVSDRSEHPPVRREPDHMTETGRGLNVVAGLSQAWGWTPCGCGRGKVIWALLTQRGDGW